MFKKVKKSFMLYILIFFNVLWLFGCDKDNSVSITGTTMDYKVEAITDNKIRETITIKLDINNYARATLESDKVNILSFLENDLKNNISGFRRLAYQSNNLPSTVKEEYTSKNIIDYERKDVNHTNLIQFEVTYKNSNLRQVWYYFVQSYDGYSGTVLDYTNEDLFINDDSSSDSSNGVMVEEGTWFNKSYVYTGSVYDYAFIPYPTFKTYFIDSYPDITFTQTLISSVDDLKTNAIKEVQYQGGLVERTWVIDINKDNQVEYYVLQANRVSWYILALAISVFLVFLLFIIYFVKKINKRRQHL